MTESPNPTVCQERDRASLAVIYTAAAVLALILAAGFLLTWATQHKTPVREGYRQEFVGAAVPREINMIDQTLFSAHLPSRGSWQDKQRALGSYSWADEQHRTVTIPIDRAMQMLVEQGRVQ